MNTQIVETKKNPGCLVQILWFAFIGWWLGQAWITVAWIAMVTVIGIPLGVWMLDRLPKAVALREHSRKVRISVRKDGSIERREIEPGQVFILFRIVYFFFIGWWLTALWMEAAYWFCMTVIGLPVGFWMFDRVPALLSLRRD